MQKYSKQVQTTKNYGLFSKLDGNREPNLLHLKRLTESMSKNYLFTVIIVNEKMQVIDGQHRLSACIELGLPINYIIVDGYGLREVQILNANSKNWSNDDYLKGYCDLGLEHYKQYKIFKDKYEFNHSDCLLLLSNADNGEGVKRFHSGNFKVLNLTDAIETAEKLMLIGNYFEGFRSTSFIRVMKKLLEKENFSFIEFIGKLQLQPTALKNCNTIEQYRMVIEEIYNYKRREKVNLRY